MYPGFVLLTNERILPKPLFSHPSNATPQKQAAEIQYKKQALNLSLASAPNLPMLSLCLEYTIKSHPPSPWGRTKNMDRGAEYIKYTAIVMHPAVGAEMELPGRAPSTRHNLLVFQSHCWPVGMEGRGGLHLKAGSDTQI